MCPNKHLSLRKGKLGTVSSEIYSVSKQYRYKMFDFRNIGACHACSSIASISNEVITCPRQFDNIVRSDALWELWFVLLTTAHRLFPEKEIAFW